MTVKPLPDVTLKNLSPLAFCTGEHVVLELASPEAAATYQWLNPNTPVNGETGPQYTVALAGDYRVMATLGDCKNLSGLISVIENQLPEATIINGNTELCAFSDTAQLSAQPGDNYRYRWSPEQPFRFVSGAEGESVAGVFGESTPVILTVFNEAGCSATDTTLVQVRACCELFAPTAFSPNNDGLNDQFTPYLNTGQILLQMQVYNRYGNLVYELKEDRKGWKGQGKNGIIADAGTYMYYLRYTCTDGNTYEKKGDLILIR